MSLEAEESSRWIGGRNNRTQKCQRNRRVKGELSPPPEDFATHEGGRLPDLLEKRRGILQSRKAGADDLSNPAWIGGEEGKSAIFHLCEGGQVLLFQQNREEKKGGNGVAREKGRFFFHWLG